MSGPFAGELGAAPANLVVQARDRLLAAMGSAPATFVLDLEKHLPLAAGLGGGSSDAAAALDLTARALEASGAGAPTRELLAAVARSLGADVPACLACLPVIAEGRGDRLSPAPALPPLPAVLANPGVPSETRAVYAAYDKGARERRADRPRLPAAFASPEAVARHLKACRNDLEAPAIAAGPSIGEVLVALRKVGPCLMARMSGSGATCFGLFADDATARAAAVELAGAHPTWWVRSCRLGSAALGPN